MSATIDMLVYQELSTAMGNAATAFACSQCGGVLDVANSQTNEGGVAATVAVSVLMSLWE